MAETSGFFPDVNGDREYTTDFLALWVASFIGNGVYDGDLAVAAGSNMQIIIPSGRAWINGYHYRNDGNLALAIDNADGVLNRKDTVVLRWDINTRSITAQVLKGTPASTAAAPAIVRTVEQYDLKLAEISIPAGTTAITQALITDTRLDNSVCGIVTGVVKQVDTTKLYQQIQSDLAGFKATNEAGFSTWSDAQKQSFQTWFDGVKGILGPDEAANLLNLINDHKADTVAHMTQAQKDQLAGAVAHEADKNNPHGVTAAQVEALPHNPSVAADPDNTTDGFHYYFNHIEIPGNTSGDGEFLQISHDANYIIQVAYSFHSSTLAIRVKDAGTWQPWSLPSAIWANSSSYASGAVALTTPGLRNNVISSTSPSGGNDGDTWDQV